MLKLHRYSLVELDFQQFERALDTRTRCEDLEGNTRCSLKFPLWMVYFLDSQSHIPGENPCRENSIWMAQPPSTRLMMPERSIPTPMTRSICWQYVLLAIRMAHQGRFSVGDIALAVGRSKRCIRHWLQTYRQGGMDGLLARSNGHRQAVTVKPALSLRYKPPSLRNCAKGAGKRPKTSRPGCAKSMALS